MEQLIQLLIILAVLLIAWYIIARFSPDPMITKICQIVIFVIALIVILRMLLPLAGVGV
jgi:hypothetical protein